MAQTEFKFNSASGESFIVVSFDATEGISQLYRYEIELKAPENRGIDIHEILDDPVTFVSIEEGIEYPVHGILASLDEIKTLQGYVYYSAVLVPQLWKLSLYKTNEIYTEEKTVDNIIQTVLEGADLHSGDDFELSHLNDSNFLQRDYVCQFGESDFDFISRLMENEGIFYYFDHSGDREKIIFVNDAHYPSIDKPDMMYETHSAIGQHYRHVSALACRVKRLPGNVSVRDYNPDKPSHDIANTQPVDNLGNGTEYLYGNHITNDDEATHIAEVRAEEMKCNKTRYYGESHACRFQAGYSFALDRHPNSKYNGQEYLLVEVTHHGSHLDMAQLGESSEHQSTYHNSFVAIDSTVQFRPPLVTPKPRFYGTMTAFVYAEAAGGVAAEVDEQGRYRVLLPFDRADGTKDSADPNRKSSAWVRMAQPYAGENEGMCFPLKGGTEVLLTFINGDPDQPIISATLPNAATPSLINDQNSHVASINTTGGLSLTAKAGTYSFKSSPVMRKGNQASASWVLPTTEEQGRSNYDYFANQDAAAASADEEADLARVNQYGPEEAISLIQREASENPSPTNLFFSQPPPSTAANFPFSKLNDYGKADTNDLANVKLTAAEEEADGAHIDRTTGPTYVHKSGSTFPYPEQERVYFFGTFHEDFHMDDMGISGYARPRNPTTGLIDYSQMPVAKASDHPGGADPEIFHFPAPGGDGDQSDPDNFPTNRVRGVSEDKRWGDQMTYGWGRQFNWSGGNGTGGSFETINYGNGTTEDLIRSSGGRFSDIPINRRPNWEMYNETAKMPTRGVSSDMLTPYSPRDYEKKYVDGGNAPAAYTFVDGNTYSYQSGDDLDVNDGESDSWTFGNSREYVTGSSCSWVSGNSFSETIGGSIELIGGVSSSTTIGITNENFLGGKIETCAAITLKFELAGEVGLSAVGDKYLKNEWKETDVAKLTNRLKETDNTLKKIQNSLDVTVNTMKHTITASGMIQLKAANVDIKAPMAFTANGAIVKLG